MHLLKSLPSYVSYLMLPVMVSAGFLFAMQGTALAARQQVHHQTSDSRDAVLKKGDCLDALLSRNGVGANQQKAATRALEKDNLHPRALRAGSRILLTFARGMDGGKKLLTLRVSLNGHRTVLLASRADGSFSVVKGVQTAKAQIPQMAFRTVTGHIGRNFQSSLNAMGVPVKVVAEAHRALVYAPDLPAHPPAGSWIHIVYETTSRSSYWSRTSAMLRSITLGFKGRRRSIYRYPVNKGMTAFVEPDGLGVLLAHLADPAPQAHITSPWGWRIHPILDRPEFHKGIDMAAPMGTPIRAPANGKVVFAGWHGNYGLLLKIEHIRHLVTAYGHLEKIARGLHDGSQVRKGQVIGYIGSTGLSTGPHLYYEVWVDGRRVNPAQKAIAVPVHLNGIKFRNFLRA